MYMKQVSQISFCHYQCLQHSILLSFLFPIPAAYPYLDSSFTLPQEYTVQVGHISSPLPCGFVPGGLASLYYEAEWWRGIVKLDLSDSKYEILSNYSLVVHNATMRDSSGGYYCHVRVFYVEENKWYGNSSPDIKLNVYGKRNR